MKSPLKIVPVLAAAVLLPACAHVTVDPIEVKEIHIVHDVNIKVDKQLDDFFAFQDQHPTTQSTTAPTTTQASVDTGDVR
jgi:hypothetical protein